MTVLIGMCHAENKERQEKLVTRIKEEERHHISTTSGARVGEMGGMFTMEEYASTDDDDDMNGEDDDMRNAVMF